MPTVHCSVCGRPREIAPSHFARLKRPDNVACSEACRAAARRGNKHWNWKGGRKIDAQGYIKIIPPTRRQRRGKKDPYVYEHDYVMERHLERRLRPNERVTHKDGDRQNNRFSNLRIKRIRLNPRVQTSARRKIRRAARADV